jgi:hypothetical protein
VLYGNDGTGNDTWEWDGTSWTDVTPAMSPPGRRYPSLSYDPARKRVVMFGGVNATQASFNDTWEWDGTAWTEVVVPAPPGLRWGAALAYDAVHRQQVLFGGDGVLEFNGETWTFDYEAPASPAESCAFADQDTDGDGLAGCADPDCWGRCDQECPPATPCTSRRKCGDGICDPVEDYLICPADCVQ